MELQYYSAFCFSLVTLLFFLFFCFIKNIKYLYIKASSLAQKNKKKASSQQRKRTMKQDLYSSGSKFLLLELTYEQLMTINDLSFSSEASRRLHPIRTLHRYQNLNQDRLLGCCKDHLTLLVLNNPFSKFTLTSCIKKFDICVVQLNKILGC